MRANCAGLKQPKPYQRGFGEKGIDQFRAQELVCSMRQKQVNFIQTKDLDGNLGSYSHQSIQ